MSILLTNCHVISPDYDFENVAVLIEGEKIKQLYPDSSILPKADESGRHIPTPIKQSPGSICT